MNKAKLIVANWKMNFFHKQACNFCKKIISKKKQIKNNFIICPPSSLIFRLSNRFRQINFGAQDCSAVNEFGAYTGDINSKMLKDINCKYTLIGHSERRELYKEDESLISLKILSALKSNIKPILCVGENLNQKRIMWINVNFNKLYFTHLKVHHLFLLHHTQNMNASQKQIDHNKLYYLSLIQIQQNIKKQDLLQHL